MPREEVKKNLRNEKQGDFIHLKGSEMKPGQKYPGIYMGSYTDKMYSDERHMLKTAKGDVIVFREWAQLKAIFGELNKGESVEITFVGKKNIGKGKKVMEFSAIRLTGDDKITVEKAEENKEEVKTVEKAEETKEEVKPADPEEMPF